MGFKINAYQAVAILKKSLMENYRVMFLFFIQVILQPGNESPGEGQGREFRD